MQTKPFFHIKALALAVTASFLLVACGKGEAPDVVLKKFKQQIVEINSGNLTFDANVTGSQDSDSVNFSSKVDVRFNRKDLNLRKSDVSIALNGNLNVGGKALEGDMQFNFRNLAQDYYIQLIKLTSTDPSVVAAKDLIAKYEGQWLHVSKDFIPEDIRKLEEKDEAALAKEEQLKQLFVESDLFTVTQDLGEETINGSKAHHYQIAFTEQGVKDYMTRVAQIDGRELTTAEIDEAAKIVAYFQSTDLWIGSKDYSLYKATTVLNGQAINPDAGDMTISIDFTGADYNEDVEVEVPADSREFNPIEVLMGLSQVAPQDGAMEDEAAAE